MKKSFTAKLWKVMRICAVQAVIAITLCGVTLAHPNYAQVLDREISITITDLPFENALHEIERVANVKFAYSISLLQDEPNVSLTVDKRTLREALDELLTPRRISYKVHEKEVTISLKKNTANTGSDQSQRSNDFKGDHLKALMQVTGTVTEASTQMPMAGVNVLIKGSTNGTTTDVSGRYSIFADDKDILVFSFIGYSSQEIPANGRTVIDVAMREDVTSLSEVVINAGYWEVKDQERTGNISRVTADEIQKQPVSNPLQAMQGRMPGVYVQQNTGVPGGGFKIQIRGENSLRAEGNAPLYVIDGVPFTSTSLTSTTISGSIVKEGNPLAAINPGDIESIEVLKDADATAIYGSRGANGVVLITTRQGKAGKTKVDVNINQGVSHVSRFMNLLNTEQYVDMRIEGMKNQGNWPMPAFLQPFVYDIFYWDTTRYTNWQKELIGGTANTTNALLSISGGNATTQFSIGSGYYRESTVYPGNFNFQRVSGSLNLIHTSDNRKFKTTMSVGYTHTINNLIPTDLTNIAITLPPHAPALYNEDGEINWDWNNNFMQNPLTFTMRDYQSTTDNLLTNATFSYEILPDLHVKSSLGYTMMLVDELSTSPLASIPPQFLVNQTGSSSFGKSRLNTWILEPQIRYMKKIAGGNLNALVGSTFQESVQEGQTIIARGYTNDALLKNMRAATSLEVSGANHFQYRYAAMFGRINYILKDRYIVNLTGRRDGSSRFGPGKQFGNFGAAGLAWIFTNEEFVATSVPFMSFGKLRASYGVTGSDAIGNYQYLNTYSPTTHPYNGTTGLVVTRLDNPDYSWETNRKLELGLESGFFRDRLTLSVSWYKNRSTNQLVGLPLPILSGQPSVQFNLPATVENYGWEFLISSTNIRKTDLVWTTSINITLPRNVLREFPGLEGFPAYNNNYQVGKSVFTKKTLRFTGVDSQTGLYAFEDVNGDGNISLAGDGLFLKEVSQQLFGGMSNNISYKGVQLDIFLQFVKQTGHNYRNIFSHPGSLSNQPDQVTARWREAGNVTAFQMYAFSGAGATAYNNLRISDQAISDASFIRLKNVALSWQLPLAWVGKAGLQNVRIYAQAQNLLTFTDYVGLDPETQSINFLPPLRTITMGLHVTF
ncbi:MAG: SusC/RagA family TonB-linked outer membrane protein [Cyclobacteriaceae bacterium]|nr:SusC/RagA family TonB-linked outer membrane protein [Cyclobacteriaceae bacterium]